MHDADLVAQEVRRLHTFFEDWFQGDAQRSIDEFSEALDARFFIVTPDGAILSKAEIVDAVERRFGAGKMGIAIENVEVVDLGEVAVCRYEEVQETEGHGTRRLSTAVLVDARDAPGGFRWMAVHETWTSP